MHTSTFKFCVSVFVNTLMDTSFITCLPIIRVQYAFVYVVTYCLYPPLILLTMECFVLTHD